MLRVPCEAKYSTNRCRGPFGGKAGDLFADAVDIRLVDRRDRHERGGAGGRDRRPKRGRVGAAAPVIGLETFDQPLRLQQLDDMRLRAVRPFGAGMTGIPGDLLDSPDRGAAGDMAPEAGGQRQFPFDEEMHRVVRDHPLLREGRRLLRAVGAADADPVAVRALADLDLHPRMIGPHISGDKKANCA